MKVSKRTLRAASEREREREDLGSYRRLHVWGSGSKFELSTIIMVVTGSCPYYVRFIRNRLELVMIKLG